MSIPASEFRVDRPGRYRARDGRVAMVTVTNRPSGYISGTLDGERMMWRTSGNWYFTRDDETDYDLIAYLGPLEDEPTRANEPGLKKLADEHYKATYPEPAISDAAWKVMEGAGWQRSRGDVEDDCPSNVVLRTREEWEERGEGYPGIVCDLLDAQRELTAARAEVERLKLEIDKLEKSRNHCEFCDAEIAKPVQRVTIPMTTPQIERYIVPMLGTQR